MNTKKCVVASVLCLMTVLLAVFGLSACADCNHEWSAWTVTKEASCDLMGMQERECALCGEIEKEAIAATGHIYGDWIAQSFGTCGTYGQLGHYHCDGCGTDFDADHKPLSAISVLIEHEWLDATCTTPKTCKYCAQTEGEALGHINTCANIGKCARCKIAYNGTLTHIFDCQVADQTYRMSVATCDTAAIYYYSCACGNKGTETFAHGDPLGHTYSVWMPNGDGTHTHVCINDESHTETVACHGGVATCTDQAMCEACGELYGELPAHTWDSGVVAVAATCTENGVRRFSCAVCHTTKNETIVATGHLWSGVRTCASGRVCGVYGCGATEPPLGHNYTEIASTDATCTENATKTYLCSVCRDTYVETVEAAVGHNFTGVTAIEERVGETCEYVLWYTCNTCHEEIEGQHVFRHTYKGSITTSPTCIADGEMTYTCTNTACEATADQHSYTAPIVVDDENRVSYHLWTEGNVNNGTRTDTCVHCQLTREVKIFDSNVAEDAASNLANADLQLKVDGATADENVNVNLGNALNGIDESVKLEAEKLEGAARPAMPAGTAEQIGDNPVYNFTIKKTANGEAVTDFEDNYVTITVPYTLQPGEDADAIFIWFVSTESDGTPKLEAIKAEYNDAGYVTFKTNHFSYYTVTRLTPEQRCEFYGCSNRTTEVIGDCLHDSYTLSVCVRCHKTVKTVTQAADGHYYKFVTTEATCETDGKTVYTCKDCGHSYEVKLPANGHVWERTVTPATCETNGSAHHKCTVCNYKFTDNVVPALGHDYAPVWTWAKDYSEVSVVFVCSHNAAHKFDGKVTLTVMTMEATCTRGARTDYSAKAIYNGVTYSDVKTTGEGTPNGHSYSKDWKYDDTNHWHVCVICGTKAESAAHKFATSAVSVQPTCVDNGERIYFCECGATKTEVIAKTGTHLYENGVCVHCGKKESSCNHEITKDVTVDLADFGACGGTFTYQSCECGDVYSIDEASQEELGLIDCDLKMVESKQEVAEDGMSATMTMKMVCSKCGLTVDAQMKQAVENCFAVIFYDYDFSINGKVILENLTGSQRIMEMHNREEVVVDLSEYTDCGGSLFVEVCKDCGKTFDADFDLECDGPFGDEEVEIDGALHYREYMTCDTCGLKYVIDEWMEQTTTCIIDYYYSLTIYDGDEVLYELVLNESEEEHKFEYDVTKKGDDCYDGWTAVATCKLCGRVEKLSGSGHLNEYSEIDAGELGFCEGEIELSTCVICNAVTDAWLNTKCQWHYQDDKLSGSSVSTCRVCGVIRYQTSTKTEKDEECRYDVITSNVFYQNDKIIFQYERTYSETDHDYRYTFNLHGTSCTEGVDLTVTCACGFYDEWTYYAHNIYEIKHVEFSEHGACGGYFEYYACACGEDSWRNFNICNGYSSTYNSYLDEDGNKHQVEVRKCEECGLEVHLDYYTIKDEGSCRSKTYYSYIMSVGTWVEKWDYVANQADHDYTVTGSLQNGATSCEDGAILTYTCKDCGYSYDEEVSYHLQYEVARYNLDDYGSVCHGYMSKMTCACGRYVSMDREDAMCELDTQWCEHWITGIITESQPTAEGGWYYPSNDAWIYTCAVTDPEQCELKIRWASYYRWDSARCIAYQYETWQFGYDPETGEYEEEITFKTGSTMQYHDYTREDLADDGYQYTCKTCGGYYKLTNEMDANDNIIRQEIIAENKANNGHSKYYQTISTYTYNGQKQNTYEYYQKRIEANDSVNTNERRYVYNNGYQFLMYEKDTWRVGSPDEYWYSYEWADAACVTTMLYNTSNGYSETTAVTRHPVHHDETTKMPTCTQPGYRRWYCPCCNETTDIEELEPDHNWSYISDDHYVCTRCGLENTNGASGSVVIEDLTDSLGNGVNYVLGYYARKDVTFTYYVSLILHEPMDDGNDEIILMDIEINEVDGICGLSFSKAAVEAAALEAGYAVGEYDVRFAFVPEGADANVDCAITFTND